MKRLTFSMCMPNKQTPKTNFYILGQNIALTSIPEVVDLLLKREMNEVYNFDGECEAQIGKIFVPETYLPKIPRILDADKAIDLLNQISDDHTKAIFFGDIKHTKSNGFEKHVYDVLKSFYESKTEDAVIVIQGIDIFGIDEKIRHEFDFLVINYSLQYILHFEVKKWLGDIKGKNINVGTKVVEQLQKGKRLIEDWFSADLRGNWKLISAVYCNNMDRKYRHSLSNAVSWARKKYDSMLERSPQISKFLSISSL